MIFIEPKIEEHVAAFDYVSRDLRIDSSRKPVNAFRESFIEGLPWTQSDGLDECCIDHLQGRSWEWPWLVEWKVRFANIGAYPKMWTSPREASFHSRHGKRIPIDPDVYLFSHTFSTTRRLFRPHTGEFVRFPDPLTDEPPTIQKLESDLVERYVNSNHALLPPFYPGCRMGFSFMSERNMLHFRQRGATGQYARYIWQQL